VMRTLGWNPNDKYKQNASRLKLSTTSLSDLEVFADISQKKSENESTQQKKHDPTYQFFQHSAC
jgi:hypothetical protein